MTNHNFESDVLREFKITPKEQEHSRYAQVDRVLYKDGTTVVATPHRMKIDQDVDDTYYKVGPDRINRLDLISYDAYGTALLWWVIAEASYISDPFTVPIGTILRIPSFRKAVMIKDRKESYEFY